MKKLCACKTELTHDHPEVEIHGFEKDWDNPELFMVWYSHKREDCGTTGIVGKLEAKSEWVTAAAINEVRHVIRRVA